MTVARVTQDILEVLAQADDPNLRVTQDILEVLVVFPAIATRIFPIVQTGRITNNGGGTRVFPV